MAPSKKKKKPAANPARGFATTSIASKPRPETAEEDVKTQSNVAESMTTPKNGTTGPNKASSADNMALATPSQGQVLSPEEFERQLEESELQLLVEKHGQKVKRDAQRQRTRLETDRRLLRGQADSINSLKWLPQELMDYILDLIKAESRFASSNLGNDAAVAGKLPSEEDTIARLWTLQQTLEAVCFPEHRIKAVIQYISDIASNVSTPGKDLIWGLEEALEWLARECDPNELPKYESKSKPIPKGKPLSLVALFSFPFLSFLSIFYFYFYFYFFFTKKILMRSQTRLRIVLHPRERGRRSPLRNQAIVMVELHIAIVLKPRPLLKSLQ
jgi:ATP-dependent RNA helicase DHX29